jgi:cytochrome b pre-mRNA-processing protein 3
LISFSLIISRSIKIHKSLSKVLCVEGGPRILFISFLLDVLIINFFCFSSRFRTPCFLTTLFKEQFTTIKENKIIYNILLMNDKFLDIYNNLINYTRNKELYLHLNRKDNFSDRLTLFLLHFAFYLKNFKNNQNKAILQEIYDFNFRQIELSIREIGYGDQSINKKMKDYVNLLHSMISEIHFWDKLNQKEKNIKFSTFLTDFTEIDKLVDYFDDFNSKLLKKNLNSF